MLVGWYVYDKAMPSLWANREADSDDEGEVMFDWRNPCGEAPPPQDMPDWYLLDHSDQPTLECEGRLVKQWDPSGTKMLAGPVWRASRRLTPGTILTFSYGNPSSKWIKDEPERLCVTCRRFLLPEDRGAGRCPSCVEFDGAARRTPLGVEEPRIPFEAAYEQALMSLRAGNVLIGILNTVGLEEEEYVPNEASMEHEACLRRLLAHLETTRAKAPTLRAISAVLAQRLWPDGYVTDEEVWMGFGASRSNFQAYKAKLRAREAGFALAGAVPHPRTRSPPLREPRVALTTPG